MGKALRSKRIGMTAVSLLLGLLLALGALSGLPAPARAASGADEIFTDYPTTAVTDITNRQFDDSGTYPVAPSGWTESGLDGAVKGNTKSGVINLDPSVYATTNKNDKDKLGLYKYPEYAKADPQTPFGTSEFPETNKKVLMINTDGSNTAVGYTSATFTLEANSFYSISVYVKTGDFAEGQGASVKLTGVDPKGDKDDPDSVKELAFYNIDTVDGLAAGADGLPILTKENRYGFTQYKFYIETSYVASTASLVLSVGAKATDEEKGINYYYPASGYAFFDNVEIDRLSPMNFRHETTGLVSPGGDAVQTTGTTMVASLNRGETFINGDFSNDANGTWTFVEAKPDDGPVDTGNAAYGTYNANQTFSKDNNAYHLTADPVSPTGKDLDSATGKNIFVISSYDSNKDAYGDVAVSIRSADFTVPRHSYTRVSVWAKTQDVEGGNGASVAVVGEDIVNDSADHTLNVSQTVTGDEANASRYGWKEYAFYLKGSTLRDYTVHLELRLGAKDSKSRGVAMFGDIRKEEITYSEYTANSAAETQVGFDGTFADTGIANGLFYQAGDYDELKYPLAPSDWTKNDPATVGTTGFSTEKVESSEDVVSGIVPVDEQHFEAHRKDYNWAINPTTGERGNLLLISSLEPTAVCYTSPALTVTASKNYALTVNLRTDRIDDGYGAALVLKNESKAVIATIENIVTGPAFKDYTFYLEGAGADKSVTLEIWLGLNDRRDNTTKLSAGDVFVKKASLTEVTEAADMTAKADGYVEALKNDTITGVHRINYTYYSFKTENLTAFDVYDPSAVKTAYNWTLTDGDATHVTYGIFNAAHIPAGQTEIPSTFKNGEAAAPGVLYLRNTAATYSRILSANTYSLAESTYHKLTVRLKVDIPQVYVDSDTAVGAGVELTGTDHKFEDIRSTALIEDQTIDGEYYREYTFYIKAETAADVGLAITLGGNEFSNQHVTGRVYVNSIDMQEISNTEYEMKESELAELKKDDKEDPYSLLAPITAEASDPGEDGGEDEGSNGIQWWLIPSILFAVAIVIAVVGFAVRRMLDKRSKRKTTEKLPDYDRRVTLHKQHNQLAKDEDKVKGEELPAEDKTYDTFDDEAIVKPVRKPAAESAQAESPATIEEQTEQTASPESKPAEGAVEGAAPVEETAPAAEQSKRPEAEPVKKPDAYTDEFDD